MKIHFALLLISFLTVFSCKEKAKNSDVNPIKETTTEVVNQEMLESLPMVPIEIMQKLWNECEFIDYIFFDLPFSMSQTEQPSIRANLNYIDRSAIGPRPKSCKPIAREFFQINGEIVYEADVYYSEGCKYYVFFDGKTPVYANKMSAAGEQFYNQMITQALQMQKGAQGQ